MLKTLTISQKTKKNKIFFKNKRGYSSNQKVTILKTIKVGETGVTLNMGKCNTMSATQHYVRPYILGLIRFRLFTTFLNDYAGQSVKVLSIDIVTEI